MTVRRRKASKKKATRKTAARKGGTRRKTGAWKSGGRRSSRVEEINREQQRMMKKFAEYGEFASKSLSEGNFQIQPWINQTFDLWREVIDTTSTIMRIYVDDDGKR